MRYLSLFSGIEAASVAWEPLGWEPAAFAEIEKFPSEVLAHHYPHVPNLGDVTKHKEWPDLGPIDLVCGGSPCQSFSVAGLRKGMDDPRGNMALVYLAIVDRVRPTWVVFENVPGLLSSTTDDIPDTCPPDIDLDAGDGPQDGEEVVVEDQHDGNESHALGCFLAGLQELGYGFAYRILDAQYVRVDGLERAVPQRRRRIFVVGHLGDWRRAAAVLFERESLLGHSAPRRETGQRVAATLTRGAESGGKGGYAGRRQEDDVNIVTSTEGVSHCLNAGGMGRQDYETETFVAHSLRGEGFDASEDGTGRGTPLVPISFAHQQGGNINLHMAGNVGLALQRCQTQAVAIQERAVSENVDAGPQGKGWQEGVSYTLEARHHVQSVAAGWAVRRLTPTECERLQGFPDGYTAIPRNGKPAADGPRYKALGNSMACNVMRWIGQRIEHVNAIAASIKSEAA
jgi:DNA (cytosine-5)-methyltransferase 1